MDVVAELDVSLLKTTILPSMDSFPTSEDSCSFVGALLDEHGVKENDVMFLSPMPSTTAFPSVDMSCLLPRTLSPDVYTSHTSETNYDCKMIPNGNMTTETRSNNPALYGSENIDLCTGSSKSNGHKSLECNPQKANNRDKNAFSIEGTPWPECSPEHEICSCVSADMDRNTAPSSTLIHKCSFSEKEDSTNLSSLKETKKSVKAEKENAVKNETEHGVKMGVIYEKAKLLSRVLIYYPNKERRKTGSLTDTSSEPEKQFSEIPTLFDPGKFDSKDSKNTNESHNFNSYYTAREHQSPPSPACRSFTVWDNHSGRAFGDSIGVACQQFIVATAVQQDQESFIFDTTSRNLMSENGTNMNAVSTEQINDDTFLSANEYLQRSSQSNSGSVGGGRKRRIIIDKYHDETINFKTAKKNKNSNFTSNLPGELLVKQDASKDDSGTQMVCANTNFQEEERESDWIFSPTFTSDESSSERKKPHSPFKRTVSVVRKETTVESNQTNSNFVHTQSQSLQSDAESSHEVQSDFDSRLKIQSTSESGQRVVQPGQNDNFNADFDQNVQSDAEPEFHSLETEIQVPKTDYETLSIADTVSVNGEKGGTTQPGPTVTFAEEPITSPMSEEFQVNDHEEVPPSQDMHFPVSSLDNNFIVEVPGSAVSDFVFPDTVDSLNIFGDFDGNGDGLEDGFPCCDCEHCHCYYTESERFNAPSQRYSSSTNSFCSDPNCSGRYTRNSTSSYCSNPECQGDVLNPIRYPTSQHGSYSFSQSSTPEMACWYVEEDTSDAADSFRESVLSGPPVASNSENFVVTVEDVDNPHDVRRQEFPVVQEPLNQPKVGKTRRLHIHRTKQVYETYMESGNKEVNVSQAQNDYWIQQPTSGRLRKNIQSDETTAPVVPVSVEDASAQYQTFSRFNIFRWCK